MRFCKERALAKKWTGVIQVSWYREDFIRTLDTGWLMGDPFF